MKTSTDQNLKPAGETTARESGHGDNLTPAAEGGMIQPPRVTAESALDYEARLAEWKLKQGYREPLDEADEEEQALIASDRKLPGEDYCVLCGEGPQPISGMRLITHRDDPYIQADSSDEDEEGAPDNRVRACPKCFKAEYEDEEDES